MAAPITRGSLMNLYNLKYVPWLDSQLVYHAQARVGAEGLNILAPSEPYVCIGYHQDLTQEVDVGYCREHGIPVFRREVGGGAVYLDANQVFFQIVLHKDNPLVQGTKEALYERMLQPVARAYADLGVPCRYRPINDVITTEGRKISGTGAAAIDDCVTVVGNLIADFDYETMCRVLRVPDEKYRDKVFKSMRENLTTLKRETGRTFTWDEMATPLVRRFEDVLGPMQPSVLTQGVRDRMESLTKTFLGEEWLNRKGLRRAGRDVKIASGVNVVQRVHKARGGLIRATVEVRGDRIDNVSLSGDFFCYPQDAVPKLESALEGRAVEEVLQVLARFYAGEGFECPGVGVDDWLKVLAA